MGANLSTAPPSEAGPPRGLRAVTWGPGTAIVGLLAALSAQSLVAGVVIAIDGPERTDPSTTASIVMQAIFAALIIVAAVVISSLGRVPWRDAVERLGLRRFRLGTALKWMGASVLAYFAFALVYTALVGEPEQEDIAEAFGSTPFQILLVVIAAPVSEEIFFRGMFFGGMRRRMPMLLAALVSAAIFGLLHLPTGASAVPPLIVFGFIMALLYERTGSIVPCILLHMLNNSAALLAQ